MSDKTVGRLDAVSHEWFNVTHNKNCNDDCIRLNSSNNCNNFPQNFLMGLQLRKRVLLFVCIIYFQLSAVAQMQPEVSVLTSGTKTSLRGLSVVTDNVVWV